ncbi:MAG: serine hydrolase [Bacillota bacterium]
MDINLRMKSIELLINFMSHDLKKIGKGQPALKKQAAECADNKKPLPRSAPEHEGIESGALAEFFEGLNKNPHINPHSAMVLRHGNVVGEAHWAPYRAGVPHMLYSMSKSVTATAIGIAVDEGLLSLEDKLVDLFRDKVPAAQGLLMRNVTVRHLLTMSVGIRFNEVGSALSDDWERMYLESIPKFDAGSAFEYNSMNSYMLAAILRRKTGMGLGEYLKPRLFDPLGIERYAWETCPKGVEKGGWGLALTIEDAAKLGELYRRGGTWEVGVQEVRLLSEEWVREATRLQIETPNGENKHGYGFQIWMNELPGAYLFSGAFGQYVVVLPQFDAVVVLFSGSAKLFANSTLQDAIVKLFEKGSEKSALQEGPEARERLGKAVSSLELNAADALKGASASEEEFRLIAEELSGREYLLGENVASVFPLVLQGVHTNFTDGISMLRFERSGDGLGLLLYEGIDCNHVPLFPRRDYTDCVLTLGEEEQLASARCQWRRDPDGAIVLRVSIAYIETPNVRLITLFIQNERIDAVFDERPDVMSSAGLLFELAGYSHMEYLRTLVPQMRKAHIAGRLRNLIEPEATGRMIAHHRAQLPGGARICAGEAEKSGALPPRGS